MIKDENDKKLAQDTGYEGIVSIGDVMWSGPLAVGDFFHLATFHNPLEVYRLAHYPGGEHRLCPFDQALTEVYFKAPKEVIDQMFLTHPEAWEKKAV